MRAMNITYTSRPHQCFSGRGLSCSSSGNGYFLRQKLDATTKEMKKEQQQVHDLKVEIGNFKAGLHNTSQHIQEPKRLKEAVKALYRKYLRDHEQVCLCAIENVVHVM